MKEYNRLVTIDALRGGAVFVMIIANTSPYIFTSQIPMIFRVLFSLAAPVFIFLSGFSFQLTVEKGKSSKNILIRCFQVLCAGVLIDMVIWNIIPFQTYDVLYLISGSLLMLYLLRYLNVYYRLGIALTIILGTLLAHKIMGYRFEIADPELNYTNISNLIYRLPNTVKRALIDGWFPFLPWFAVVILGSVFKMKFEKIKEWHHYFGIIGILSLIISLWVFINNSELIYSDRNGYLELFYPVTGYFWLTLIGILGVSIYLCCKQSVHVISFLGFYLVGRYSLFCYIVHILIIGFLLNNFTSYSWTNDKLAIILLGLFWYFFVLISKLFSMYFDQFKKNIYLKPFLFIFGL